LQGLPGVREVASQGEARFLVTAAGDRELRPEIARLVVSRGWDLLELQSQEFTLEEVFLNLVTEEEA
jgi:ABC-2 type transport system ATP-binding protein